MITYGKPRHRQIIFEGNSLSNHGPFAEGLQLNGHYVPINTYAAILGATPLTFSSLAVSGRTQTQINAAVATALNPVIRKNDIVVIWEGTNDMAVNVLSGADAYANLVTYSTAVRALGAKLVIATVIARDYVTDRADLMTDIAAYNTLVRNNQAAICDAMCDLGADPVFDTRADASNSTYYNSDKIHLSTGGQNKAVTLLSATITTIL